MGRIRLPGGRPAEVVGKEEVTERIGRRFPHRRPLEISSKKEGAYVENGKKAP